MKLKPLSISSKRAEQLSKVAALDEKKLSQVYKVLSNNSKPLMRVADVLDLLRECIGAEDADDLLKLVLSLRRFGDSKGASSNEVFDALVAGLEKFKWKEEKIAPLRARRSIIVDILSLEMIHKTYKLADLYFGHERHLHDLAIYTELRPVFNSSRTATEGFVLYSSLRLIYSDRLENESMLVLSVKRDEVELLKDECERALKKLSVMEEEFKRTVGQSVILYSGNFTEHD
jgi:hypothetical protein